MAKKRIHIFSFLMVILLFMLMFRLAEIQLISPESFSTNNINLIEESVAQRTQAWVLDEGRGRFVDRNEDALTHDYYPTLVMFPLLKKSDWPLEKVSEIIGVDTKDLTDAIENSTRPFVFGQTTPIKLTEDQMTKINDLEIPGVFAVRQQVEVGDTIASHLIGLTRQNQLLVESRYPDKIEKGVLSKNTRIGISGLQRTFDEFLLPEGEAKLLYHVDNKGGPLFGLNVKYSAPANPYYPTAIKTTIDKEIQEAAEETVDELGLKKGGAVLLDIETSDILALVSKPEINPGDPFGDDGGINHMIKPQIPGSVFKIVSAAAALEKNTQLRGRTFNCDLNLYGDGRANRKLGHLSFEESFAQSCNYTFATIANEMIEENTEILDVYANKLGLLEPVGWRGDVFHFDNFSQLHGEENGSIWADESDKAVQKAVAQTAIGQKQVRVSPLAVANMMATIARGGDRKEVRSVEAILYKNGSTLHRFPVHDVDGDEVSSYASTKLQKLLRDVVESGTGKSFQSLPYKIAGKSGTAETGKNGRINKWFAGYFPADEPRYALVVVDLDQTEGKVKTNQVFAELVKKIYEIEKRKNPETEVQLP